MEWKPVEYVETEFCEATSNLVKQTLVVNALSTFNN